MPFASQVNSIVVSARCQLVRRPWIYWSGVAVIALGVGASIAAQGDQVDRARDAWGTSVTVMVATRSIAPGELIEVSSTEVPLTLAPPSAAATDEVGPGAIARQHLAPGEIVMSIDISPDVGPLALIPHGWLAVAVVESPPSGATIGDRVLPVSEGVVLSDGALVVGHVDHATLIAVPADVAPLVPAAADAGGVHLMLVP